jgi:hypothetical protein
MWIRTPDLLHAMGNTQVQLPSDASKRRPVPLNPHRPRPEHGQMTVKTILKQRWITPIPVARKRQSGKVPPASKPGQTHARTVTIREAPMWCASRRSPNIYSLRGRPQLPHRVQISPFGTALSATRCRRSRAAPAAVAPGAVIGDAADPVDDPTPEHVPLWFGDFDAPRGNERPSGHVSLFPRPSALCSEGGSRCRTAPVSSRSSSSISRPNATVRKPAPGRRSTSEPDTRP